MVVCRQRYDRSRHVQRITFSRLHHRLANHHVGVTTCCGAETPCQRPCYGNWLDKLPTHTAQILATLPEDLDLLRVAAIADKIIYNGQSTISVDHLKPVYLEQVAKQLRPDRRQPKIPQQPASSSPRPSPQRRPLPLTHHILPIPQPLLVEKSLCLPLHTHLFPILQPLSVETPALSDELIPLVTPQSFSH
ncbi:unnamed protein product [Acanthosepion pharaonis]|uniref:Uncharacterized protein n=1 Tax=Acanthosepion pharaonis TaxID=158019 RepID=A0A812CG49_ACAPH|nr:unnamed protein product [Sepia pharaonis]